MKHYFSRRIQRVLEHMVLAKTALENSEGAQDLGNVAEMLETMAQVLRVYQHEWQKQMVRGMAADLTPEEIAEKSLDGHMRLD